VQVPRQLLVQREEVLSSSRERGRCRRRLGPRDPGAGFDETRVFDATGAQIGTANAQASPLTGFITIVVPTALLGGTPASGWTFTVVLHGQDGYGQDGARTFAETPQGYQFGRCATAGDPDPRCAVPLDRLPKAMDVLVLVPAGATQAEILDPTHSVVLRGVPIP